ARLSDLDVQVAVLVHGQAVARLDDGGGAGPVHERWADDLGARRQARPRVRRPLLPALSLSVDAAGAARTQPPRPPFPSNEGGSRPRRSGLSPSRIGRGAGG